MRKILTIIALTLFLGATAQADFRQICRGASLYKYDNEIRKAVRAKLDEANISYSAVNVEFTRISRPKGVYQNDFAADLTVGEGDKPGVSFTGAFPDVTVCSIPLNVRITVVYPDRSRSVTINQTTVQGTLLPPLGRVRIQNEE